MVSKCKVNDVTVFPNEQDYQIGLGLNRWIYYFGVLYLKLE